MLSSTSLLAAWRGGYPTAWMTGRSRRCRQGGREAENIGQLAQGSDAHVVGDTLSVRTDLEPRTTVAATAGRFHFLAR